jgi:crotonobetainyl-CoA:carnitine CoA-transferase CaiB-like acyl-CoA transferase
MQAFKGIRVLDFTHVYAGPFATFQLAVMGAEVIKIEAPGRPDQMRSEGTDESLNEKGLGTNYVVNNQGKKAMTLDLETDQGKQIARQLIESADVLVENYSGAMKKNGFGAEQSLQLNPRLIYCEMSGFGEDNQFAGRPAYDPVIQASSGLMSLNGDADQEFLRVGPPLIDYGMGAQTAFAIAAALFQRNLTGKGQVIEANMLDAALVMMSPLLANAVYAGKTDRRSGNVPPDRPGYAVYPCRDDNIMIGAFTMKHHHKLFELLDLAQDVEIPDKITHGWVKEQASALREIITERLAQKSAADWELILNKADIPGARVRDLHDMLSTEQCQRAEHSRFARFSGSDITAPIAAFSYSEDGPDLNSHCSTHGEDTADILSSLGYDDASIIAFSEQGVT